MTNISEPLKWISYHYLNLAKGDNKMKTFKFSNNQETFEPITSRGFKRAVKEFQRSYKGKSVRIQYTNKSGNDIDRWIQVPIGRKKRGINVPEPFMTAKMKKKEEEKQAKRGYR